MRVKVGDTWYKPEPGQPIMVELSDEDRRTVAGMHRDSCRYAMFADGPRTDEARTAMREYVMEGMEPDELRVIANGKLSRC